MAYHSRIFLIYSQVALTLLRTHVTFFVEDQERTLKVFLRYSCTSLSALYIKRFKVPFFCSMPYSNYFLWTGLVGIFLNLEPTMTNGVPTTTSASNPATSGILLLVAFDVLRIKGLWTCKVTEGELQVTSLGTKCSLSWCILFFFRRR